jgi:hypothetical protein
MLRIDMHDAGISSRFKDSYPLPPPVSGIRIPLIRGIIRDSLTALFLLILVFLVPLANAVILFLLLNYLSVRTLAGTALKDCASRNEIRFLIRNSRPELVMLGVVLFFFMIFPPACFVGPSMLSSAVTHFSMRRLSEIRTGRAQDY